MRERKDESRLRESNSRPPAYKAGAITTMLNRQTTSVGFEPTRAKPSRFRICRLNHSAKMPYYADYHFINKMKKILKKKNELKSKKINATHVGNHKTFIVSRISIVVSTSRCGRENPGSNPGYGRKHPWSSWL